MQRVVTLRVDCAACVCFSACLQREAVAAVDVNELHDPIRYTPSAAVRQFLEQGVHIWQRRPRRGKR